MTHTRYILPAATSLCVALAAAVPLRAQAVANGSFEQPTVPAGGFTSFPGGSTSITGWTVQGTDVGIISGSFTQSGITFQAQTGSQWLDLSGTSSNSPADGVTQSVVTTAGQAYRLAFYVGSATNGTFFFPATADLSIDGGPRQSFSNPNAPTDMLDWQLFTAEFTATGGTTEVGFFNGNAGNNFNCALDGVTLAHVPEPAAGLAAAAVAAAGVRHLRRRRR